MTSKTVALLLLIGAVGTVALVLCWIVPYGLQLPWLLALGRRMALLAVGVVLVSFASGIRAARWLTFVNDATLSFPSSEKERVESSS